MASKRKYNYDIDQVFDVKYGKLKIIDINKSKYKVQCLICGHEFETNGYNLNAGKSCRVCYGTKTLRGYNDMWTTNPELAKLLNNPEDGYKYSFKSNEKVEYKCPNCGMILRKRICDVARHGLSCPYCGDGISYPNKFMTNILYQLNEDFKSEKSFDWCNFTNYDGSYIEKGIYDFVIENRKLIIEMDSGLGHGNNIITTGNKTKEEHIYIDNCKTNLAIDNGYNLIRIDCAYYHNKERFHICKNAVISSELSKIFDFSKIDWNEVEKYCSTSYVVKACELYNDGKSSSEIATILDKNQSTIIDYLHVGNRIGLCEFVPHKHKKKKIA